MTDVNALQQVTQQQDDPLNDNFVGLPETESSQTNTTGQDDLFSNEGPTSRQEQEQQDNGSVASDIDISKIPEVTPENPMFLFGKSTIVYQRYSLQQSLQFIHDVRSVTAASKMVMYKLANFYYLLPETLQYNKNNYEFIRLGYFESDLETVQIAFVDYGHDSGKSVSYIRCVCFPLEDIKDIPENTKSYSEIIDLNGPLKLVSSIPVQKDIEEVTAGRRGSYYNQARYNMTCLKHVLKNDEKSLLKVNLPNALNKYNVLVGYVFNDTDEGLTVTTTGRNHPDSGFTNIRDTLLNPHGVYLKALVKGDAWHYNLFDAFATSAKLGFIEFEQEKIEDLQKKKIEQTTSQPGEQSS